MRRAPSLIVTLTLALLAAPLPSEAQQPPAGAALKATPEAGVDGVIF